MKHLNKIVPVTRTGQSQQVAPGPVGHTATEYGEDTLSIELDNSAGGSAVNYIIGDGNGIYAAASGETLSNPTGGDIAPATMKADFAARPVQISSMTYIVTASANQFSNKPYIVSGGRNGKFSKNPINVARFRSASDNQSNIRTIVFDQQPILSASEGITLNVNAGETVYLELVVASYRVR